jgi:1-acyl-sn-glycerol-3-phosphate acyltransferase
VTTAASLPTGDSWASRVAYRICRSLVCWFTIAVTRMRIEGREHLPATGPYVIAPVHRSYVDTPITACISPRRIRFMGKQEVWKYRPIGWFVSALGAFPVNRGTADREALNRCITVLEGGEPLVLFPEGERKDGPLVHPLFDGAAYVAARAGVPIIPVGIGGSAEVMPRHAKMIRPRKVCVVIGAPIHVDLAAAGDGADGASPRRIPRAAVKAATEELAVELQRLFDAARERVG